MIAVGGYALACAAAVPTQGRLVDRYGRGAVLLPAALVQALALIALVVVAHGQRGRDRVGGAGGGGRRDAAGDRPLGPRAAGGDVD